MVRISMIHQSVYVRNVRSKYLLDWYISLLLTISARMEIATNTNVNRNITESPSPNHAVSEKGMEMLRYTRAKSTEKVTVPISWYFPNRYCGIFLFILIVALMLCRSSLVRQI